MDDTRRVHFPKGLTITSPIVAGITLHNIRHMKGEYVKKKTKDEIVAQKHKLEETIR